MSLYTKILRCPNSCSSQAQARYFPAQDGSLDMVVCSNCQSQWNSNSPDFQKIVDENFISDVPDEIIASQKNSED